MPSTPTISLRLEKQETGSNLNLWGEILGRVLDMVDQAIAGTLIKPLSGNYTLTNDNYVSNEARNATLIFTNGGLSAAPTVTVPLASKNWHVDNRTGFPLTFTMGGATVTVPVGRQADVFCDGSNLFMLEPIAAAAAVTEAFAQSAATSAQTAMTSASTATTRRDQALAARDETYAARDVTLAARDTTLGYRNAAATSATNAANSAAGVNLPAISAADAGKVLTVRADGSGYSPLPLNVPLFLPITMTTPAPNATGLGAGGTYTFVVQAFAGDTVGFYPDYPVPLASRFVNVFEPGGNAPVATLPVAGTGTAFPVNFTGSGLQTSHAYDFQAGYTDAQGNSVLSQRVRATTAAQFKPSVGQAYEGGYLAFEQFGDGGLFDLVTGPKSLEQSKQWDARSNVFIGALSRLNGLGNTNAIEVNGSTNAQAASYAQTVSFGTGTPYLAAIDEARAISFKLRPANAPAGSPFVSGGSEVFTADGHWSSTEIDAGNAVRAVMTTGQEPTSAKSSSFLVRPIKRISVTPPVPIGTYVAAQGGWLWFYLTDLSDGTPKTYAVFKADKAVEVTRAWAAGVAASNLVTTPNRTNGSSLTPTIRTSSTDGAAFYCDNLVHGGKDDWYLGAIDEMLAGARMNSQLPAAQRVSSGIAVWCSTEVDASTAKRVNVDGNDEGATGKSNMLTVVPIRRVLLSAL